MRNTNMQNNKFNYVYLCFFPLFFVYPILFLILASVLYIWMRGAGAALYLAVVFGVLLSWINCNKLIDGDLYWYSEQYIYFSSGEFFKIFLEPIYGVQAKETEPAYHAISWLLSNLTGGNVFVLVVFVTLFIYVVSAKGVLMIAKHFDIESKSSMVLLSFVCLFCVTFTLTNQLIRQYMASAVLLVALGAHLSKHRNISICCTVLAVLLHNSTVIPVFLYLLVNFIYSRFTMSGKAKFILSILLFSMVSVLAEKMVSFLDAGQVEDLYFQDDGAVSSYLNLIDVSVSLLGVLGYGLAVMFNKVRPGMRGLEVLLVFFFCYFVFLWGMQFSPLLYLRYYFYVDFMRWIPVIALFIYLKEIGSKVGFSWLLSICCIGFVVVGARIDRSPFDYSGGLFEYVFANPVEVANYDGRNLVRY